MGASVYTALCSWRTGDFHQSMSNNPAFFLSTRASTANAQTSTTTSQPAPNPVLRLTGPGYIQEIIQKTAAIPRFARERLVYPEIT